MSSTTLDPLAPFRQLLEAGFPAWQIQDQAKSHLEGLQRLPATVEGRDKAIEDTKLFIEQLKQATG